MDTNKFASQRFSTRILANIHILKRKRQKAIQLRQLEILINLNKLNLKQGFKKRDYFRLNTRSKVAAI